MEVDTMTRVPRNRVTKTGDGSGFGRPHPRYVFLYPGELQEFLAELGWGLG